MAADFADIGVNPEANAVDIEAITADTKTIADDTEAIGVNRETNAVAIEVDARHRSQC